MKKIRLKCHVAAPSGRAQKQVPRVAMFQTRSTRLVILVLTGMATFSSCQRRTAQQAPVPLAFFIPDGARNVEHRERQGIHEVSYEVDATYPASPFLCE